MQINLEKPENHAVQSYSEQQIKINAVVYDKTTLVSQDEISTGLDIYSLQDIKQDRLEQLVSSKTEILIIGHQDKGQHLPMQLLNTLYKRHIGVECMSIGAACRTYNILLGELRAVVALFIFS